MTLAIQSLEMDLFETDLGWFATAADNNAIRRIVMGHASPAHARRALLRLLEHEPDDSSGKSPLLKMLRQRLTRFARGEDADFSAIPLDLSHLTPFQQRIARTVRRIPRGETLSYGEVAERAGSPRAARAVGSVMANNRFPIVIPCHRVLAAGGRIGGFSAPGGVGFKERLLALESNR